MLTYHRIDGQDGWHNAVWEREESLPEWFQAASHVWTADREAFEEFWNGCDEVWGLFREGEPSKLLACVMLEFERPRHTNIHVSVIDPELPEDDLVRFWRSLKYQKALDGILIMEGWILDKNRPLKRIARRAGFEETGLVMTHGERKGKALRWLQVRG